VSSLQVGQQCLCRSNYQVLTQTLMDAKVRKKAWREKNRVRLLAYQREYRRQNRDRVNKWKRGVRKIYPLTIKQKEVHQERERAARQARRKIVISHYSEGQNICSCCGENEFRFLSIDHMNNDGNRHKRELGTRSSSHLCWWLIKNEFPIGFQVLCYNCNIAKGIYKECPHKLKITQAFRCATRT
jgi:hypothetical protein